MKTYPAAFSPVLHGTLTGLLATGLLLAPGALQMRLEWDMPWVLGSDARVWAAAAHALCFFLMLGLLGAAWTVHIRAGWVRRENIRSGGALLSAFGLLALSGLGLYYAGGEALPRWSAIAHLLAGALVPALYVAHRLGARAAAARAWPAHVRGRRSAAVSALTGQAVGRAARASTARMAPSASQTVSTES